MPDDGPGADQQVHEVDELAKGLVGLPIKLWGWRVDSSGFHRKAGILRRKRDVAWRDISAVYREDISVIVEAYRRGKPPGKLLEIYGAPTALRSVVAAWNEYSDRKIDREGCLRGEWSQPLVRWQAVLISWAVLFFGLALCVALTFPRGRVHYSMDGFRMVEPLTRRRLVTIWLAVASFGLGGVGLSLVVVLRARRARSLGRRWAEWELSPEGLAFWPDGERHLLSPKRGDVITPREARIAGEHVPLRQMAYPLVSQIALAMGERSGASVQRSASVTKLPLFLLWTSTFPGANLLNGFGEWQDDVAFSVFILGFVVVEVIIAATVPRRMLFHGRAMLERLGW